MPDWKKLILKNHQRNHKVDRSELIQGEPCSEEELARLEEMIGLKMPAEFRDLYGVADGFGSRSDKEYWLLTPIRNIPQLIKDARNWFEETQPRIGGPFLPLH